jgi:ELWxxDGT repeat protein
MAVDNRLRQAKSIALTPPFNGRDSVSSTDRDDLRRIRLDGRSSVEISLSGLKRGANTDLELYALKNSRALGKIGNIDFGRLTNAQRNQVLISRARSAKGSNANEAINLNLDAGDYYLRVRYRAGKGKVNYGLSAVANPDNAGEDFGTARLIGADGLLYSDFVGASDPADFYRFTVAQTSDATVVLDSFSGDANLLLLDGGGVLVGSSANGGTTSESITARLNPGDYYLQVNPAGAAATNYQVGVAATVAGGNGGGDGGNGGGDGGNGGGGGDGGNSLPDDPYDSIATALPIPVDFTSRFLTESVNDSDPDDYYSFTLTDDSIFNLSLSGLSADANVELLASDGSQVSLSANGGLENESIVITPIDPGASIPFPILPAGDYFLHVYQGAAGQNTAYRIDYSALPGVDRAGNEPASARDITTNLVGTSITQPVVFREFAGGADTNDYYKFVVAPGGTFISTRLDILGGVANVDLDVTLLKEDGSNFELITSSVSAGNANEAFGGNLSGGTYYLRIFPNTPEQGSLYNLTMYTRAVNGVPTIGRDINPGEANSSPNQLTVVGNNKVFFLASDSSGVSLWLADGSTDGGLDPTDFGTLQSIKKADLGFNLSSFGNLVSGRANGKDVLYFTADSSSGFALWRTDGTAAGTQSVLDVSDVGATGFSGEPVNVNGTLYFVVIDAQGNSLWRSDGNSATPVTAPGFFDGLIRELTAIGTDLYFSAAQTPLLKQELWRISDPTSSPVEIIVDTNATDGSDPRYFFQFNDAVYFSAIGPAVNGYELWKLVGSTATQVPDINISAFGDSVLSPDPEFTIFNGSLYFTATTQTNGQELYKLTPLPSGDIVTLVADLNVQVNDPSSAPQELTVVGSGAAARLYFTATDGINGRELWSYDGTNLPTPVDFPKAVDVDFDPPNPSVPPVDIEYDPQELTNLNGVLYFRATGVDVTTGNNVGNELWKISSPGSAPTVFNILPETIASPDPNSSTPSELTEVLGRLFFVANNGNAEVLGNGSELWVVG